MHQENVITFQCYKQLLIIFEKVIRNFADATSAAGSNPLKLTLAAPYNVAKYF